MIVCAGVHRRFQTVYHFFLRHQFLAGPVSASFGSYLIFDVYGSRTCLGERLYRTGNIECRRAEACVNIHQQWQGAYVCDAVYINEHILQVGDTEIGNTQRPGGNTASRKVDGTKSGLLRQQRVISVDRTYNLQRAFIPDRFAETKSWRVYHTL